MNMHVGRPAEGAESISAGLATQQRARLEALETLRRLRKEASAEIERLIAFMDASDGYTLHEREAAVDDAPCDDNELEPSLCGVTAGPGDEHDREDDDDGEPMLGWTIDGCLGSAARTSDECELA